MSYLAGINDSSRGSVHSTFTILGTRLRSWHAVVQPASAAWPLANLAILVPFAVSTPLTLEEMFWFSGTTPGTANIDLGVYRDDFTLVSSIGATASVSTTDVTQPTGGKAFTAGAITLAPGRYYMAMSAAAITITTRAAVNTAWFFRALGLREATTSQPLPATITTQSYTRAYLPMFGMMSNATIR